MAEIKTTPISGNSNVGASLPTINENFDVLTKALNSLGAVLDLDAAQIKNIKSLIVSSQASAVTDVLISTNGSIQAGGNLAAAGAMSSKSATIENDVIINKGSLTIASENSTLDCNGKFILGGEFIMNDFNSSQIINASYIQTWQTSINNNLLLLLENGTYAKFSSGITGTTVGGVINLSGRSGLILDWSQYGSDEQHMLDTVLIDTVGVVAGQKISIVAKLGINSGAHTFKIAPNTIAYPSGQVLESINFTSSYNTIELIFDGVNWIVLNLNGTVLNYIS